MKESKTLCKLDSSLDNVERFIGNILENDNFNELNYLQVQKNPNIGFNIINRETNDLMEAEFITFDMDSLAPYSNLITEKEFFRIVGANEKGIYKKSGLYQESLYNHYLEAKLECDKGYIEDVLKKAIVFEHNKRFIKYLMKDPIFMREWRRNFGSISPLTEFKNTGSLKKINTIKNLTE